MKRVSDERRLTEGIDALARAADKASARGRDSAARSYVLGKPSGALARDEVLIAVADTTSVVLKLVKIPRRPVVAGRAANPRLEEVARRIAEIDLAATEIARAAGPDTAAPPPLTDQEERVLREGELDPRPLGWNETHLLYHATAEYARLLNESYTVEEVARLLGVNTSRIRQRLIGPARTLFGVKLGKAWRVPTFQFQGRRLVPGLGIVLRRLPGNLHPVALHRWFTSPNPDLASAGGTPISPLGWLRTGNPPEIVAELAGDL